MLGAEPFDNAEQARTFIRAGNARVTLVSQKTSKRYTYRVRENTDEHDRPPHRRSFYVDLLKGPDNESDYTYIGMIRGNDFFVTRATQHLSAAEFVQGFGYVYKHLCADHMPPHAEVWHESRCGRCNRPLTVPESIRSGLGPECIKMVGR